MSYSSQLEVRDKDFGRNQRFLTSNGIRSHSLIRKIRIFVCLSIMNKQGIVEAVHVVLGGTKVQAEAVVDKVLESIVSTLKGGEEVSIAGLGIFSVKQRAARQARNPRTGEMVQVAAMKVPKFRAAKALKDAVK